MNKVNNSIRCDVCDCCHNVDGCNCTLSHVKITCDRTNCTICDSYKRQ